AKKYDEAVALLVDLRDLAKRSKQEATFAERVRKMADRHSSKPTFMQRLRRAGLWGRLQQEPAEQALPDVCFLTFNQCPHLLVQPIGVELPRVEGVLQVQPLPRRVLDLCQRVAARRFGHEIEEPAERLQDATHLAALGRADGPEEPHVR